MALALGHADVDAMLDSFDSRTWSEWQVFWHLYGFGEKRMDVRFAQLMTLLANLVRGKDSQPVTVDDMLADDDSEDDDEIEVELSGDIVDEDQLIFDTIYREATD